MRRIQRYYRCLKRRSGEALVTKKAHGGRKLQGGQSLFSRDEIRRDLAAWLHRKMEGPCIGRLELPCVGGEVLKFRCSFSLSGTSLEEDEKIEGFKCNFWKLLI
ncbi:LOW QUALITY PROTEIN: hypothetical protein TorRG33x02_256720 [Trema orientale]|uniref:Uncharacterized protein n=1 Tax=Trema orientale TaxID=63057 RepID=A0A2P5DB49_TREOI|nr:LOW QUALITY PROTEIN: hypothetical protein TorRG33x02_256720 [Trema orientale]